MLSPPSYRLRRSSASVDRSPPVMRLPLPRSAVFESAMTSLRVSRRPTSAPGHLAHMITHPSDVGHVNPERRLLSRAVTRLNGGWGGSSLDDCRLRPATPGPR